jgi:hypothetical protein
LLPAFDAPVNLGDDAAGFVFARFFGCARSHASPNFGIALIAPLPYRSRSLW